MTTDAERDTPCSCVKEERMKYMCWGAGERAHLMTVYKDVLASGQSRVDRLDGVLEVRLEIGAFDILDIDSISGHAICTTRGSPEAVEDLDYVTDIVLL